MQKVVIVEDDQSISFMYKMKFETEGFQVETALNGAQGLEVIDNSKPDIVLLDLMMPIMSGDQMLNKLRQTDFGINVPVVVLTNVSDSDAPAILAQLNVAKYIVKAHVTPQELVDIVRAILDKK
jgi:two-component system, OmpR family, response regulator MprA